jgi:hypothetical protein
VPQLPQTTFRDFQQTEDWPGPQRDLKTIISLKGTTMNNPKTEVLPPHNSQLIFIDQQPQMAFGVQSIDRQTLKNNTVAMAKATPLIHENRINND